MAEDSAQQPSAVDEFMQKIEAANARLAERFDASLGQVAQRQDQLAQYVAEKVSQPPRVPQPSMVPPADMDQKLLEEFFKSPTRFVAELGETIRQQNKQVLDQELTTREQQRAAVQARENFWAGWATHNGDVAPFQPMVEAIFHSLPANADPSKRADEATNRVRELIAQRKADAIEDQRRQDSGARMLATASGRTDSAAQRPERERPVSERESQAAAISELEEARMRKMVYG